MVKSRKKDTYWHNTTKLLLSMGFKPAQVGKILKEIFPETEVNGRHIGAYKRRLVDEDDITIPVRPTMSIQEAKGMVEGLVTDEDRFIYDCSIGSTKRSLKCFEYKLTAEAEHIEEGMEEIDLWVSTLTQE